MASNLARQRYGRAASAHARSTRSRKSVQRSIIAPVGGLNTLDALGAMPSIDAWRMTNWLPDTGSCRVRPGYSTQAVDMDEVFTVSTYEAGTILQLLAATETSIYNVTNGQAFIAPAVMLEDEVLTSALTITDAKTGALSMYVRPREAGRVFGHDRFDLQWTGTKFQLTAKNAAGTTILDIETSALTVGKWYNLLISWTLGSVTAHLYVNNASDLTSTTVTDDTIDYDFADFLIGEAGADFDLAEPWFDDGYIDFSVSGNRTDFIDTSGRPISLGADGSTPTGAAPLVYLSGARNAFLTNLGTGEDFTGSPAEAYSSPSQKPVLLSAGFNSGRWQVWQFNGILFLANGADTMQTYNGTSLSNSTFTGPTLTDVIGGNVFKNRVYVWEDDSSSFWYGGVNSVSGAMTEFDLSRVGQFGGNLVAMVTWTFDGGDGVDDYAVFLMSSGESIIYQGSNPGDSAAWALVGVYRIGAPLGIRSAIKFGGDVMIQAQEDIVLLSRILKGNNKRSKISGGARDAAEVYGTNLGWQIVNYPKGGWVLSNIPVSGTAFEQHVLNTVTGAWTKFEDINARCWCVHDRDLFFGGADGVYQADDGTSDNGAFIDAEAYQAWNPMGYAELKRFAAFRPVMQSEGTLTYNAGLAFDYGSVSVAFQVSQASPGTLWGSPWGSLWSPSIQIKQDWRAGAGIGNEVSIRMRTSSKGQTVKWFRTDYLFERGGVM